MTLMWAGRVSKDKNVSFLFDIYRDALKEIPDLNLIVCGDGPDLEYFKKEFKPYERIHVMGRVDQRQLQCFYDVSDLFVFPSATDTFGMVILECQAKGVPALVTDIGGPQEIIRDGKTGYVLSLSTPGEWVEKIVALHCLQTENPNAFAVMRAKCQRRALECHDWERALADMQGDPSRNGYHGHAVDPSRYTVTSTVLKQGAPVSHQGAA